MFSEFITIDGIGVESSDLIYGFVKGYVGFNGCHDIVDGIHVRLGKPIAIDDESRLTIEDGLAGLLGLISVFGHSNPPI